MAKQIKLLCAVALLIAGEEVTKPAGSIEVVEDAVADDLLFMSPPAAELDNSPLPASATTRTRRTKAQAPAPEEPAQEAQSGDVASTASTAGDAGTDA